MKKDLCRAISDYIFSIQRWMLSGEENLQMKLPVIREFVDTVRVKYFSDLAVCRRMDTTLKMNVNALNEMIQFLNFYHKESDASMADFVSNTCYRGGDKRRRYSLMPSSGALAKMRRRMEALAIHLIGAAATSDNIAAQIDVGKYIDMYFVYLYKSLGPEYFDEYGVCKFQIYLDLTNDGTVYSNMSLNIAGLKLFAIPLKNADGSIDKKVKTIGLLSRTMCIPLSVFIDKDSQTNVFQHHGNMYKTLQDKIGKDGVYKLNVDGQQMQFVVNYAFSGDLKSHAQVCGMSSLSGSSRANYMFCCNDRHEESLLLENFEKCPWCENYADKICRHIACHRHYWQLPEQFKHYQSIIDVARSKIEERRKEKEASAVGNATKKRKKDHMNLNGSSDDQHKNYIHFMHRNVNKLSSDLDIMKKEAKRMSEFATDCSTKQKVDAFLKSYKYPIITLEKPHANSALNSTVYVGIADASLEQIQHHLRIRVCHSRPEIEQFLNDSAKLNRFIIDLLESEYEFTVDDSINSQQSVLEQSRSLLQLLLRVEGYVRYFVMGESKIVSGALVNDKIKLVICDLHMEMRVGLSLLQALINNCCFYKYDKAFAQEMMEHVEYWINTEVFRNKGTGKGSFKFPLNMEGTACEQITLTNKSLVKILGKIDKFMDLMQNYKQSEQHKHLKNNASTFHDFEKYKPIFSGFIDIMRTLRLFDESNTDDDYINWQLTVVDPWIEKYIALFGASGVGYYVHYLARGHVCEQLMHFKNVHRHSQQNWEGLVGVIKKYIASHTQHGGNGSGGKKGNSKRQESLSNALLRYMLRFALYALFPNDDDLMDLMEEHNDSIEQNLGLVGMMVVDTSMEGVLDSLDMEGVVTAENGNNNVNPVIDLEDDNGTSRLDPIEPVVIQLGICN